MEQPASSDPLMFEVDDLLCYIVFIFNSFVLFHNTSQFNSIQFQDMAPIQGDPLLSEASSVIEIQKTIESAGVTTDQAPSLGSEIPSDQQWVNTPQSSEWT